MKIVFEKKKKDFAKVCLAIVAVLTIVFTGAMIWVFRETGIEMATLEERWFTVVGVELGGLLIKRIIDKKRENKEDNEDG